MTIPEVLILPLAVGFWAFACWMVLKAGVAVVHIALGLYSAISLSWDLSSFKRRAKKLHKKTALKSEGVL